MVFTYSTGIVVSANYFWINNQRKKGPSTGIQFWMKFRILKIENQILARCNFSDFQ